MHLLIDIRHENIHETLHRESGKIFGKYWQHARPTDTISYLVSSGGEIGENQNTIVLENTPAFFPRKKITVGKTNEVFRCINFSPFAPYDVSVPTISHITHNAEMLYPQGSDGTWFGRRRNEWKKRKIINTSRKIIVSNLKTGQELVELFDTKEEKIEIIPYFPFSFEEESKSTLFPNIPNTPYFIYDGKYGIESNLVGLLAGWAKYRQIIGGTHHLVLTGFAGDELSHITQMLRAFDITESVTYTGTLGESEGRALYEKSAGWIYTGSYWSGGARIELAHSLGIPLLLSDIPAFEGYTGIKIHPNHLENLHEKFAELERIQKTGEKLNAWEKYIGAYEKILIG